MFNKTKKNQLEILNLLENVSQIFVCFSIPVFKKDTFKDVPEIMQISGVVLLRVESTKFLTDFKNSFKSTFEKATGSVIL